MESKYLDNSDFNRDVIVECDVNDTDNYKDFIELVEELEKKLD